MVVSDFTCQSYERQAKNPQQYNINMQVIVRRSNCFGKTKIKKELGSLEFIKTKHPSIILHG
jgi:hypothetical protein